MKFIDIFISIKIKSKQKNPVHYQINKHKNTSVHINHHEGIKSSLKKGSTIYIIT